MALTTVAAMRLTDLGWTTECAETFAAWSTQEDVQPGRVAIEFNHIFRVYIEGGEIDATAAGRLKHRAATRAELPAVGDWVAVRKREGQHQGTIVGVLPRRSRFSRKVAGEVTTEQVVAANVDVLFVVMALDADFSPRRLERYLLLAREGGAVPVVLLTKPDVSSDVPAQIAQVAAIAGDVAVHVVSPKHGQGLEQVAAYLTPGRTAALLGSSGVGKTTLINRLVGGGVRKTREVRAGDSKGRHTTMHRELVVLPNGGLLIDTPGMRELQLWDVNDAVRDTFDDIEALAPLCRFTDCRHRDEPKCAVKEAVAGGRLGTERLASYLALHAELAHLADQQEDRAILEQKRHSKLTGKIPKRHPKREGER